MIVDDPEITLDMFLSICSSSCQGLEWILTVSLTFASFSSLLSQGFMAGRLK